MSRRLLLFLGLMAVTLVCPVLLYRVQKIVYDAVWNNRTPFQPDAAWFYGLLSVAVMGLLGISSLVVGAFVLRSMRGDRAVLWLAWLATMFVFVWAMAWKVAWA